MKCVKCMVYFSILNRMEVLQVTPRFLMVHWRGDYRGKLTAAELYLHVDKHLHVN